MAFFDDFFDHRRGDWGQLQALKQHDAEIEQVDANLSELARMMDTADDEQRAKLAKLREVMVGMQKRLNRVELVTEALFLHLEEKGEIDRDRVRELMVKADERDGVADGRAKKRST